MSREPGWRTPSVVVVGSLNVDLVVPVVRHPRPGETLLGGRYFRNPGGKGANQAVAAARLGQRVAMVGRVGEDEFGQSLLEALRRDGVQTDHVHPTASAATGVAFVQVGENGENTIVVSPGANALLSVEDVRAAAPLLEGASVVLLQLEVPLEAVIEAAKLARGLVILNPAPAQELPRELLEHVDLLVPNQPELAAILGTCQPENVREAETVARRLRGPKVTVVTMGGDGALLVTRDEGAEHVPAVRVEVVDTTAAGDSFCGALADALAREERVADAVRWAVQAASIAVTRHGAQAALPTQDEVAKY